jgi:hypothetical protein
VGEFVSVVGVVGVLGVDGVLPTAGVLPESESVDPESEEVSSLELVPLSAGGAETVELSLVLEIPELESAGVPVVVSLALCARAGSKGITTAIAKIVKKTAHPVTVRRKKSLLNPPPFLGCMNREKISIGFGCYGFDPVPTPQIPCLQIALKTIFPQTPDCGKLLSNSPPADPAQRSQKLSLYGPNHQ